MNATVYHGSRRLAADELIDCTARCPICLSPAPRRAVLDIQVEPQIQLLECPACHGCSASYMPRPEVLSRLYRDYYGAADDKRTHVAVRRFARRIARHVEVSGPVRIIDFGGGDGSLAIEIAKLLDRPAEIVVVDFHAVADSGDPRISLSRVDSLNGVAPADLVLASAILEHLPEAHQTFTNLFRAVAPGGYFYARTPWTVPMSRLTTIDMTYPFHVHDIGAGFWNRVGTTFGLSAELMVSRPSPIETSFRQHPARTTIAMLCKSVAAAERLVLGQRTDPLWSIVGGWEAMFQF
jgi:hypothetical protein